MRVKCRCSRALAYLVVLHISVIAVMITVLFLSFMYITQLIESKRNSKNSAIAKMAAQCYTSQIFAVTWGYLSVSENIVINHVLPEQHSLPG